MFDAARLVFIDETSANTKMMRLHGRVRPRRAIGGSCPAGALEDDHLRGCSASTWHESITDKQRINAPGAPSRESTGQIAYLWLKWTLKEKDPELTSARGSYRQLPQLVAKFTKSAAITHSLLT